MSPLEISIVVTIVDGDPILSACLQALLTQNDAPSMEIIVPYDQTIAEVETLATTFPRIRFLPLGKLVDQVPQDAFGQHELYDRRRSEGLLAAQGQLIAMLEDRGPPDLNWARTMVDLHASIDAAAIGGGVENGAEGALRRAVFFCDFNRYQPPFEPGDREYVTDVNICYRREALYSVRPLWEKRYQEAEVNWELRRQGGRLYLSDKPLVRYRRTPISLWAIMKERVQWGRLFAQVRGRAAPTSKCFVWAIATPVLPLVLFVRHFRMQLAKPGRVGTFLTVAPVTLLLLSFWAIGEFVGYCEAGLSLGSASRVSNATQGDTPAN